MKQPWFALMALLSYIAAVSLLSGFDWRLGGAALLYIGGRMCEAVAERRREGEVVDETEVGK